MEAWAGTQGGSRVSQVWQGSGQLCQRGGNRTTKEGRCGVTYTEAKAKMVELCAKHNVATFGLSYSGYYDRNGGRRMETSVWVHLDDECTLANTWEDAITLMDARLSRGGNDTDEQEPVVEEETEQQKGAAV